MALRSDRRLKQADKVFLDCHTPSLLCSLHSDSQRQLQPVGVCVCVCVCGWGGCISGLGLEHIFVCVFERAHLSVWGFKCLVLDVCLRVNLQPSVFVQDLFSD